MICCLFVGLVHGQKFEGNDFIRISSFLMPDGAIGCYDKHSGVKVYSDKTDSVEVIFNARCSYGIGEIKVVDPTGTQNLLQIPNNSFSPVSLKLTNIVAGDWLFQFINDNPENSNPDQDRNIFIKYIEIDGVTAEPEIPNQIIHYYQRKILWDPNTEEDLKGYKVYFGNQSRNYGSSVYVGNVIMVVVDSLKCGLTYFYAVTAIDTAGNESDFSSNEPTSFEECKESGDRIPPNSPQGVRATEIDE